MPARLGRSAQRSLPVQRRQHRQPVCDPGNFVDTVGGV
jgi:hypothetical protein